VLKKILIISESINIEDSSASKVNVALILNLAKIGCEIRVLHYTRKETQLGNKIECIAIPEIKFSLHYILSRTQRVFQRLTKLNVPLYFHRKHDLSITANLYGKSNIKEISKNKAFYNVYEVVKKSTLFNGSVFCRFITYAINSNDKSLINLIKEDLKKGLLSNRGKDITVLTLLFFVFVERTLFTKLIHRVARL